MRWRAVLLECLPDVKFDGDSKNVNIDHPRPRLYPKKSKKPFFRISENWIICIFIDFTRFYRFYFLSICFDLKSTDIRASNKLFYRKSLTEKDRLLARWSLDGLSIFGQKISFWPLLNLHSMNFLFSSSFISEDSGKLLPPFKRRNENATDLRSFVGKIFLGQKDAPIQKRENFFWSPCTPVERDFWFKPSEKRRFF